MKRNILFLILFLCTTINPNIPTISKLSLDEKIGQLFMVPLVSNPKRNILFLKHTPYQMDHSYVATLIKEYHVGGLIFLGYGISNEQQAITKHLQSLSPIPLLVAQDLEWGLTMRLHDGLRFPHAMTLGALSPDNDYLIYEIGKEIGEQCKGLGVQINFAPVADVNNNPHNPIIHDRSFGSNPQLVAHKALLLANGMQDAGILACAKHFPGHGDTANDSHIMLPTINHSLERLQATELFPFKKLIDNNINSIMTAHLNVPKLTQSENKPTSLSSQTITQLLRNTLEFNGLIVTDGLGMRGITNQFNKPGEVELQALLAGNDLLVAPVHVPEAIVLIKQALKDGLITEKELDEHVIRILKAKKDRSFIPTPYDFHNNHAQTLKQKAYEKAITLVKNENNILPLNNRHNISIHLLNTDKKETVFSQTIQNHITFDHNASNNTLNIIGIYGLNKKALIELQHKEQHTTSRLTCDIAKIPGKKIIVLFGSPYAIEYCSDTDALIVAYEDDPDAQTAAAQAILGLIKAEGQLPIIS